MSEKKQSAGGAWTKKSKSGKEFYSISIGDKRYTMFKNDYKKEGSKEPDYRLYLDEWKPNLPPVAGHPPIGYVEPDPNDSLPF
jgi:uncharacterized protein (DUF736 family)